MQEKLFAPVVALLMERGLILKKGTTVDSTVIAAPPSTKNREKKRDPDAYQTKKGNNRRFGYKAHIGVDRDSGLVHHLETTAANVHDVTVTPQLLHGEEASVHGDSGYLGAQKREDAVTRNNKGKKIRYKINRRPSQNKQGSLQARAQMRRREKEKSSVRAKVEHVFWCSERLVWLSQDAIQRATKTNRKDAYDVCQSKQNEGCFALFAAG